MPTAIHQPHVTSYEQMRKLHAAGYRYRVLSKTSTQMIGHKRVEANVNLIFDVFAARVITQHNPVMQRSRFRA